MKKYNTNYVITCYILHITYYVMYIYVHYIISLWVAVLTGWETKNRYAVTDIRGEAVFYVAEESNICERLCLGKYRSCEFSVYDRERREVLRMIRPFRCDSCCCPCYLQVRFSPLLYVSMMTVIFVESVPRKIIRRDFSTLYP